MSSSSTFALLLVLTITTLGAAQPSPAPDPTNARLEALEKELAALKAAQAGASAPVAAPAAPAAVPWYQQIAFNAFASTSWGWNFNRPDSGTHRYRSFDYDHNTFRIDGVELVLQKPVANPGDYGFRIDVTYGAIARGSTARGLFRDPATGASSDIDLQQAIATYIIPIGRGLRVDAGKFVTMVGNELIPGYDGWNDHFSHSWLFTFGPFTHTGLKLSYQFHDKVAAALFLFNGWDNVVDNNQAKSFAAQISVFPHPTLSLFLTYVGGPERDGNNDDFRHLIDFLASWKPHWRFSLVYNMDWGMDTNSVVSTIPGAMGASSAQWIMAVLYLRVQAHKRVAVNARGEAFWDRDGNRTGTAQLLLGLTLTAEFKITDSFFTRIEGRLDQSDQYVFERYEGALRKYQSTLAFNALYAF
jgi:hypothetical protein